jgi:hypothetical protein
MDAKKIARALVRLAAEGICPRCSVYYRTAEGGEPKCLQCNETQAKHLNFTIESYELDEMLSECISDLSSRCLAYNQTVSSQVKQIIELEDTITRLRVGLSELNDQVSGAIRAFQEKEQI